MRMSMTVLKLADRLHTEADAYLYLEELRWNGRPFCPHCGSVGEHYFLNPANGKSRKTRTGAASERRVWKCRDCRKQFSVLTGTIFHGTKIPVRMWLLVMFDDSTAKNGISAPEIERKYGLCPRTAWHLMHRLREAMKSEPIAGLLSGIVIADETWYGGKPSNRHGHKRKDHLQGQTDKTPIIASCPARPARFARRPSRRCRLTTCARFSMRRSIQPDAPAHGLGAALPPARATSSPCTRRSTTGGRVREPWRHDHKPRRERTSRSSSGRSTGRTTTSASSTCTATSPSSTSATRPASRPTRSAWER